MVVGKSETITLQGPKGSAGQVKTLQISEPHSFSALGGSNFGGLTASTVANNAVMNWKNNGNANVNKTISIDSISAVTTLEAGNVAAIPNLVIMPVCSFFEAGKLAASDPTNNVRSLDQIRFSLGGIY